MPEPTHDGIECAECGALNKVAAKRAARLEARIGRLEESMLEAIETVEEMTGRFEAPKRPRLDVVKGGDGA